MTIDEQIQLLCGLPAVTVESEETPADQDIYFSVKPAASGSTTNGGNDIFCFGADWGTDTVEQLENGSVTLYFAEGSAANWNAESRIYSDGVNSVTVRGCADVTVKFGTAEELPPGAFAAVSSEKIFS